MKLVDMAYDINYLMISLDHKVTEQEEQDKRNKDKTVYLTSTGVDMVIQRDIIKRELIRHASKVSNSIKKNMLFGFKEQLVLDDDE